MKFMSELMLDLSQSMEMNVTCLILIVLVICRLSCLPKTFTFFIFNSLNKMLAQKETYTMNDINEVWTEFIDFLVEYM